MTPQPTFTVVMPAYNAASTIGAAIRSVLAQTRRDFELVVVDDGSTDATAERIRPFETDRRVRVVRQPNAGLGGARNAAIAHARGRYVSLLDSDDLWLPCYLEVMGKALDEVPAASMAYADAWVLDDSTRRIARAKALALQDPPEAPPIDPGAFMTMLLDRNFIWVGVTLRRSVFEALGPFRIDLQGVEDHEMWLRLLADGRRIVYVPRFLALYRQRVGQMSLDPLVMTRSHQAMYRLVAETYDLTDEQRAVARRRQLECARHLATLEGRRPAAARALRLRYRLGRIKRRLLDRRLFLSTPPREVAAAFPDLHAV
jgi:Glycosyl transferase family 2